MSFAGAMTVIGTHLTAAGTAVTPAIRDVARGVPVHVPGRLIRWYYAGDGPAPHYPSNTLTDVTLGERVTIAVYWPLSDSTVAASLDEEIFAVKDEIKSRLIGDSQLGGNCDDLDVGDASVDYPVVNGQQVAELLIPITLDIGTAYTIAP